jgi:hypothetical protein
MPKVMNDPREVITAVTFLLIGLIDALGMSAERRPGAGGLGGFL